MIPKAGNPVNRRVEVYIRGDDNEKRIDVHDAFLE